MFFFLIQTNPKNSELSYKTAVDFKLVSILDIYSSVLFGLTQKLAFWAYPSSAGASY